MPSIVRNLHHAALIVGTAAVLSGCSTVPKRWTVWKPPAIAHPEPTEHLPYRVAVGDVLRIQTAGSPQPVQAAVEIDGRIHLDDRCEIEADGRTAQQIASELSVYAPARVEVAEFASQVVHVSGVFGKGAPKAVGYHGPETVDKLIDRIGCKECVQGYRVRVVRAAEHVGGPPEIFSMEFDEHGVNRDQMEETLYLRPGDFIYVDKNIGRKGPMTLLTDRRFRERPTTWIKRLRFAQSADPLVK